MILTRKKLIILLLTVLTLLLCLSKTPQNLNTSAKASPVEDQIKFSQISKGEYFTEDKENGGCEYELTVHDDTVELSYVFDNEYDPSDTSIKLTLTRTPVAPGADKYIKTAKVKFFENGQVTFTAKIERGEIKLEEKLIKYIGVIDYESPIVKEPSYTFIGSEVEYYLEVSDDIKAQKATAKSGIKSIRAYDNNGNEYYKKEWQGFNVVQTHLFEVRISKIGEYYIEAIDNVGNIRKYLFSRIFKDLDASKGIIDAATEQLKKTGYNAQIIENLQEALDEYRLLFLKEENDEVKLNAALEKLTLAQKALNNAKKDFELKIINSDLIRGGITSNFGEKHITDALIGDKIMLEIIVAKYDIIANYNQEIINLASVKNANLVYKFTITVYHNGVEVLPKEPITINVPILSTHKDVSLVAQFRTGKMSKLDIIKSKEWIEMTIPYSSGEYSLIVKDVPNDSSTKLVLLYVGIGIATVVLVGVVIILLLKKRNTRNKNANVIAIIGENVDNFEDKTVIEDKSQPSFETNNQKKSNSSSQNNKSQPKPKNKNKSKK